MIADKSYSLADRDRLDIVAMGQAGCGVCNELRIGKYAGWTILVRD